MGQTLTNGIYLPAEGERNCYEGLAANWTALDSLIGGYNAHIGNTTIHVTAEDKAKWDAVTGKANDTDVVHKNGAETIAGPKTFSDNTNFTSDSLFTSSGALDVSGGRIASIYRDKDKKEVARLTGGVQSSGRSLLEFTVRDIFSNVYQTCGFGLRFQSSSVYGLIPITGDTHIIGESNVKLKSVYTNQINGINPGALFLPQDRTARVDISAYFTNTANGALNRVTPPEDGYIFLTLTDALTVHCFSQNASNLTQYGQTFARPSAGQLYCLFPVRKNDKVAVQWYTTAAAVTVSNAFFIPCKGNI